MIYGILRYFLVYFTVFDDLVRYSKVLNGIRVSYGITVLRYSSTIYGILRYFLSVFYGIWRHLTVLNGITVSYGITVLFRNTVISLNTGIAVKLRYFHKILLKTASAVFFYGITVRYFATVYTVIP